MTPVTPPRDLKGTLIHLALAGVGAALLARGVIMILLAPSLAALSGAASANAAPVLPARGDKGHTFSAFPQLAPEKDEVITPIDPGAVGALATAVAKAPFVPLNGIMVVGITWSSIPELSLASMVYNNEHGLYSINECEFGTVMVNDGGVKQVTVNPCNILAEGYLIREVRRFRVKVEHLASGEFQYVDLYGDGKTPLIAAAIAPPPAAGNPGDGKGKGSSMSILMDNVRQTGANSWESPAGMREEVLGRLAEVAMEGRWIPFFENGKISGFKLAQTVPNSAFEKIGLKSGDVIKSVNGFDISSPDKMLDVFTRLRDARDVNVDILRGDTGQKNSKTNLKYTIN